MQTLQNKSAFYSACLARSLGFLLVLMPLATGCGGYGYAKVSGQLSGKTPNLSGTVYAYTDSITRRAAGDTPNQRVAVVMSGAHFNPSIDYAASKDGAANIQQVFSANDLFVAVFHDAANLKAGSRFLNNNVDFKLIFAGQHPGDAPKLGSQRSLDVTLTAVDLSGKPGRVRGNFDLYISRLPNEDPSTLIGHLRGDFEAPLVDSSISKSNIKLYGASVFDLLPLNLFSLLAA